MFKSKTGRVFVAVYFIGLLLMVAYGFILMSQGCNGEWCAEKPFFFQLILWGALLQYLSPNFYWDLSSFPVFLPIVIVLNIATFYFFGMGVEFFLNKFKNLNK